MRAFHSPLTKVTAFCLLLALPTACGQRGPLFLPDKTATSASPAQESEATDDQKTPAAEGQNAKNP